MCQLCVFAKENQEYRDLIRKMQMQDQQRLQRSKINAAEFPSLNKSIYSSVKLPLSLNYPMFEARVAYCMPNNYFQNIILNDEKLGNSFAHGSTRSIFFAGSKLMIFSKALTLQGGDEFFTSFLLLHLEKGEYKIERKTQGEMENAEFQISANVEKPLLNLISAKPEKKRIEFRFVHQSVKGRIVSKDQVATSSVFKNVYGKHVSGAGRTKSMDLEGYAITVPHFAPHPFMLQLHEKFGYSSNREFQEHIEDYFVEHM